MPTPPPPPMPSASGGSSSPLPSDWAVPAVFRRRLGAHAGRQRAMVADGHLLLILNAVPEPGSFRRKGAFFWRDPKGEWRSTTSVEALRSLRRLVDDYVKLAAELEDRLEKSGDAHALHEVLSRSVPVSRAARNLHVALQDARQAVDDPELINLRDHAGEAERMLELVREDARIALEFVSAQKSEEQAEQSARIAATGHRLNLLAAIFLPVTALGAIFGMNLVHGMEDAGPAVFWLVAGGAIASGAWLLAWTRRGGN